MYLCKKEDKNGKSVNTKQISIQDDAGDKRIYIPQKGRRNPLYRGAEILPAPLTIEEEEQVMKKLGGDEDKEARSNLIEHNLRLVVYIAKKFDNTGVGVEDLISIGTIGTYKSDKHL